RLREMAFLNKGICIKLIDDRTGKNETFLYNGGIVEYVRLLNQNKKVIHEDIVYVESTQDEIEIEVAFQYNEGYTSNIYSFT
ncbi:MAG: DNA topoisomerase IV subunit B, partial [Bacilli bacterium]